MRRRLPLLLAMIGFLVLAGTVVHAEKSVSPMYGGVIIDGYDFGKDAGPKGSIGYDPNTNQFNGFYSGLKMPSGRRAIFAWLHDTVNQKTTYLGAVGWLDRAAGGKQKRSFTLNAPPQYKGGKFGTYEIIAFSSEATSRIDKAQVVESPTKPNGSDIAAFPNPAFYLFAALPGADTELHYCGHGQDFFYAHKDGLAKQTCYD